jgi:hypothetical protein
MMEVVVQNIEVQEQRLILSCFVLVALVLGSIALEAGCHPCPWTSADV